MNEVKVSKPSKAWIGAEGQRNRTNARLYTRLITMSYGLTYKMFIGHHLAYKLADDDITTMSEIPSADTLIFDHPIMIDVFGAKALDVMAQLARVPCEQREAILEQMLADHAAGGMKDRLCEYTIVVEA